MIKMSQIESIRQKYDQGIQISQICREENVDYKTAKKYINKEDFSEMLPIKKGRSKKIDAYTAEIDKLLTENKNVWKKQRLTSKRIYDLLKQNHTDFNVSYDCVNRYVQKWRKDNKNTNATGFSHLVWHPGEAQADFGEADIDYFDKRMRVKYFVMSFPYSNVAYMQMFLGETCECVCQGLQNIFEYFGGVPNVIVFDNATGIGQRISKVLTENKMFASFRTHYGFTSRFCNPYAGHEKGSVEKNVGYLRKNILVPIIKVEESLEKFNKNKLFTLCQNLMDTREHYIHKIPVMELFKDDKKALHLLPSKRFEVRGILTLKTDNYANITLDGVHKYTIPSEFANTEVIVEKWAWKIVIFDINGKHLEEYERVYGDKHSESIKPVLGLNALYRKPGMWSNSKFREILPVDNPFRIYIDSEKDINTKHKIFMRFYDALEEFPYDVTLNAFSTMADKKVDMTIKSNVMALCSRLQSCPWEYSTNSTGVDLNKYAIFMESKNEQ